MKRFFKSFGWALLYIAVYFGASIVISMMVALPIIISDIMKDPQIVHTTDKLNSLVYDDIGKYATLMTVLGNALSFLIFFFIYKGRKKSIFKVCNFKRISPKTIGLILLLGITTSIFIGCLYNYITQLPALDKAVKSYEEVAKLITGGNIIVSIFAVVIAAPLFEEIFVRGIIFNELKNGMPFAVAFILQALAFGLIHGNLIQGSYAFALALILCLVYVWFKSLWANILLHFAFNTAGVLTDNIPKDGLYPLVMIILSAIISAVLLFLLYKTRVKSSEGPDENLITA